ncbi:PREDICTED: uncharacterized protein C14orf178-like [Cercocebus atys]|uniref:Uncharacterized protein n=1 Tax=Cercocebus atys TaxID=9531 RepID=A0A2K5MIN7_CERAT|nr:PREDICTED: uncharacterized protein C14orf178-like [Cercocebus atys]
MVSILTCEYIMSIYLFIYLFEALLLGVYTLNIFLAGHELLTSGNPPTSAFQSAGIIGMNHHARLLNLFLNQYTNTWSSAEVGHRLKLLKHLLKIQSIYREPTVCQTLEIDLSEYSPSLPSRSTDPTGEKVISQ